MAKRLSTRLVRTPSISMISIYHCYNLMSFALLQTSCTTADLRSSRPISRSVSPMYGSFFQVHSAQTTAAIMRHAIFQPLGFVRNCHLFRGSSVSTSANRARLRRPICFHLRLFCCTITCAQKALTPSRPMSRLSLRDQEADKGRS